MIRLAYDNDKQRADIVRSGGKNLDTDQGLVTLCTILLFSDARALDSDDVDPGQDKRGWWAEQYLDPPGQRGSRLWLLRRAKLSQQSMRDCSQYAKEALQLLIDIGVAETVTANTVQMPRRNSVGLLTVGITRPNVASPRFEHTWEVTFGEL